MTPVTTTRETEVTMAIAETILTTSGVITSTQSTISQSGGTTVGAQSVPLVTSSGFAQRGYVTFWDASGERQAVIKDVAGNTIDLDFSGYATAGLPVGLQYAHVDGTLVATNLMTHKPIKIGPMLRGGNPVVAVWPRSKKTGEQATRTTLSPVVVRVQIHLPINISESDPIDEEIWNDNQQERVKDLMKLIENAINGNRHLNTGLWNPGPHAEGLGTGGQPWGTTVWDHITERVDIPQFVAAMDVVVRPIHFTR